MTGSGERVRLAMVGCGGMGRRTLRGFHVLQRTEFDNCHLAAVCDVRRQNAEDLADEAQGLLGYRPRVVYALFESGTLNRPVSIAEVEQRAVGAYQQEIDEHLELR